MSVTRKSIAYNGVFAFLDKTYTAISSLLLIPFIVRRLGMDTYGIWVVLSTVSLYFALGNCGILFSYEKYIAQYRATGDDDSLRRYIATAFYGSLALGAATFCLSLTGASLVFYLLLKNDSLRGYSSIFLLLMGSVSFSAVSSILTAIPRGMQRFDYAGVISMLGRTLYIASVVFLFMKGFGLLSLVISQYALLLVTSVLSFAAGKRFFKPLSLSPALFDRHMFKTMFSFGLKMQVSVCSVLITQSFDKLIMASFLGMRFVAVYDIGSRLVVFLKDVPAFLYASLTPRTSELHALENRDSLHLIYRDGTKYLSVFCLAVVAFLAPVAPRVLALWMRTAIDPLSVFVFQALIMATMFNAVTGLGTSIGIGIGKPGDIARSNILMALVNIVCSLGCFFTFGAQGIVWGTVMGLMVSSLYYFVLLNRSLGISQGTFWRTILIVPCALNATLTIALTLFWGWAARLPVIAAGGKATDIIVVAVNGFLVTAVSAACYAVLKYFTVNDLRRIVPVGRRR